MMRSLYSGITGLKNFQVAMDVVGNNISNVNTVGFKASRVNFETMLAQTIKAGRSPQENVGGTNPMQIGLGSQVSSIDKIMTQGSFQNTGVKTDLAIQGDGFFIVSDGSSYYYTRAGAFTLDSNGNLIQTSTGYKVQGWTAVQDPETGERYIDTNKPIGDLVISAGMTMPAKKTSNVRFEGNLNSKLGPGSFVITLTDENGINHDVRVWFEKTQSDLGTDPFSSSQRYTMKIDIDNDGTADVDGYMVFNEFGRVEEAGVYAESQTMTAIGISGTTTLSDGTYQAIVLDSSGNVVYNGTTTVSGGSFTISDPDIVSGNNYTVILYSADDTRNVTASSNGSISDTTTLSDGTYQAIVLDSSGNVVYNGTTTVSSGSFTITDPDIVSGNNYTVILSSNSDAQTITAIGISGTTTLSDGTYQTIVLDSSGNVVYNGTTNVSGGSFTINDSDITAGNNYTVILLTPNNASNSLTIAPGAELVIPTSGEPRFYESDNPTNFVQTDYTSPRYTTAVQVYDSLGNAYTVYYEFVRLGNTTIGSESFKNAWIWRAYTDSGEPISLIDEDGGSGYVAGLIDFDESGRPIQYRGLDSSYNLSSGEVRTIQFDAGQSGDGVVTITADFSGATQFSGDSTLNIPWQDGNPMGVLESFAINEQGEIIGTFSNGLTDVLGQIALAVFNNPSGLSEVGNSLYVVSANSGVPKIGAPGSGGRGILIPGALEMSNVDLAEEFTKMIVAQRGFQANARVITTADQILNELVNIKR
ncbi:MULTISPECIES: flagellar hook-basal body complex protein [unclassified Thermotoga]|uniref:flagellar hook-basal body complex protein n=1 Tax=unclassified Thermotoga TaxID=2631113 RepID=UPI000540E6C2|nr:MULTISPECIES: flagellar hook-basal body complex protein [unclassified Thermotoga]AIY87620.1 flagellar hook-basal body protein [Thermotoga sp. Cell2]KHC92551.1 flagellar hook-basal body protein [Thermotoga sp. TBGT1765]KHC93522.1 flagellar hook-basal body protein [Thermotoga sp. TBGT1766]KHC96435.1 flagellar hook-basal body protein [Thermotoga sp. Xyl54]